MFNQSTNIVNENAGQVRLVLFLNESLLNDITVEIIVINGSATGEYYSILATVDIVYE